jgi:hypothetical protein
MFEDITLFVSHSEWREIRCRGYIVDVMPLSSDWRASEPGEGMTGRFYCGSTLRMLGTKGLRSRLRLNLCFRTKSQQ